MMKEQGRKAFRMLSIQLKSLLTQETGAES